MTLRGIIFDMDGTLVDSGLDFAAIRHDIGLSDEQPILEGIEAIPGDPERKQATEILRQHEHIGATQATPFPGVTELLARLDQLEILTGVLTRNSRHATEMTFNRLGWTFAAVLTREDAPAKPDPTGVLAICNDWNLSPADVLFVGDYLFDLQAGHNAGTRAALFVPGARQSPDSLPEYAEQADWVVTGYDELTVIIDHLIRPTTGQSDKPQP